MAERRARTGALLLRGPAHPHGGRRDRRGDERATPHSVSRQLESPIHSLIAPHLCMSTSRLISSVAFGTSAVVCAILFQLFGRPWLDVHVTPLQWTLVFVLPISIAGAGVGPWLQQAASNGWRVVGWGVGVYGFGWVVSLTTVFVATDAYTASFFLYLAFWYIAPPTLCVGGLTGYLVRAYFRRTAQQEGT